MSHEEEILHWGAVSDWHKLPRASVGAPSLGSVQGQAGWGFGQPGLVGGVPAHGRGLEVDDL